MSSKPNSAKITEILYPEFDEIITQCKLKINEKYANYGNSWIKASITLDWWEERLKGEIGEIFDANTIEKFLDEIPDAINILAFMYTLGKQKVKVPK